MQEEARCTTLQRCITASSETKTKQKQIKPLQSCSFSYA